MSIQATVLYVQSPHNKNCDTVYFCRKSNSSRLVSVMGQICKAEALMHGNLYLGSKHGPGTVA